MIPRSEVESRVRTRFEQESSVRWASADIVSAINEGLDELSERTHFYQRYVSIPVVPGRVYYNLTSYIPDDAISLRSCWSTVRADWLEATAEHTLEPSWEEGIGDPQKWFPRGALYIGVYPHPAVGATAPGYMRLYFSSLAPHFSHSQAVLGDLTNDFVPALVDYALYELQARDGESKKALIHWKSFDKRAKLLEDFVARRGRSQRVSTMGGG